MAHPSLRATFFIALYLHASSLPPDLRYVYSSTDSIDERQFTPGGVPLIYRDFDLKFLKQMKRFPSRRHTLIPDCGARSSIDLHSLTSQPNSPSFTHTAQSSSENEKGSGDTSEESIEERLPNTKVTISEQPLSCFISADDYSPNTGNRLNNNVLELSSCETDGRISTKIIVDTVVRSPNTFSGRICGVPQCERAAVQGRHQKCTLL